MSTKTAIRSVSQWVKIYYGWRPNLPDEGGNHLFELAVAGSADEIVTSFPRYPGLDSGGRLVRAAMQQHEELP